MSEKAPSTLSTSVLSRFLTKNQLEALFSSYYKSRKTTGGRGVSREESLEIKLTDDEVELLKSYLFDTDITVKELAEQYNIKGDDNLTYRMGRIALRYMRQNCDM